MSGSTLVIDAGGGMDDAGADDVLVIDDPAPEPKPEETPAPKPAQAAPQGGAPPEPPKPKPEAKPDETEAETDDDTPATTKKVKEIANEAIEAERQRVASEQKTRETEARLAKLEAELEASKKRIAEFDTDPLAAVARAKGLSELELITQINKDIVAGKRKPVTPVDETRKKIAELEKRLEEQNRQVQTKESQTLQGQIRGAVRQLVTDDAYPLSAAYDADATADLVTREVWAHYEKTGSVDGLDVHALLAKQEQLLREDLTKLTQHEKVLAQLGLTSAKQTAGQAKQTSTQDSPPAAPGTLTHSEIAERTDVIDSSDDAEDLSDGALLAKAIRARRKALEEFTS